MRRYLELVLICVVAFSSYQFYYVWWVWKGFSYLELVAYSLESRPFVYRLLVPFLSRLLEQLTGIHAVYCMIFLVVIASIGLYYALRSLYTAFVVDDAYAGMFSFVGCELTFLLLLIGIKVYDIATVMFFTLSLGLLARGRLGHYYLLFVIASINRETTFLLILFFMVYFYNKIPFRQYCFGVIYQGLAYLLIKIAIMAAYSSVPGTSLQWRPMEVIKGYVDKPVWFAVVMFIFFCAFIVIALRRWSDKPLFLRVAFSTIFPVQLILHIFAGYAYEIRVFAEVFLSCSCCVPGQFRQSITGLSYNSHR
ncbi:MAG: hypothetical protein ABIU06_07510 [Anaerolineales bacterium]